MRVILDGAAQLEDVGVPLRSMTEPFDTSTSIGRFVLQLLGSLAELERETIAERSKLGKLRASREGLLVSGKAALDYRREDRQLVIDEGGAAIVRRIFDLYLDDRLPMEAIASLLNAEAVPTPGRARLGRGGAEIDDRPGRWTASRVARILRNLIYVGRGRFTVDGGKEVIEIPVPPLIAEERFALVAALKAECTWDAARNAKYLYLLKGLARCEHCGGSYMGNEKGGRRYYRCWRRGDCPRSRAVRGEDLEEQVWDDIRTFIRAPGRVIEQVQARLATEVSRDHDIATELARFERLLGENDEERQRLLRAYRRGVLRERDLDVQLREVEQARLALEQQRDRLPGEQASSRQREHDLLTIEGVLTSLASGLEEIEAELASDHSLARVAARTKQREVIKFLVSQVTVRWDGATPTATAEYVFEPSQGSFKSHSSTCRAYSPRLQVRHGARTQ